MTLTRHFVTLDELNEVEEPIVVIRKDGNWTIDSDDGENLATGEEWIDCGVRSISITTLTPGVDGELLRNFVRGLPIISSLPVFDEE